VDVLNGQTDPGERCLRFHIWPSHEQALFSSAGISTAVAVPLVWLGSSVDLILGVCALHLPLIPAVLIMGVLAGRR
jgi:hypothetical protein